MSKNLILNRIIKDFLIPKERMRKGKHSGIDFISETINRVGRKYFNIEPYSIDEILEEFFNLNYNIKEDDGVSWSKGRTEMNQMYYINVDAESMKMLRLTVMTLTDNTGTEKRELIEGLSNKLKDLNKELSNIK